MRFQSSFAVLVLSLFMFVSVPCMRAQMASQTTLNSVNGSGSQRTLTAAVTAGSDPVYPGTVTFYDGKVAIASRQLIGPQGTASFRFILSPTTHAFMAVFTGTKAFATSRSSVLSALGTPAATTTSISASAASPFTLTGTVTGNGTGSLASSVVFLDSGNNNPLASSPLGSVSRTLCFDAALNVTVGNDAVSIVISDMNGTAYRTWLS